MKCYTNNYDQIILFLKQNGTYSEIKELEEKYSFIKNLSAIAQNQQRDLCILEYNSEKTWCLLKWVNEYINDNKLNDIADKFLNPFGKKLKYFRHFHNGRRKGNKPSSQFIENILCYSVNKQQNIISEQENYDITIKKGSKAAQKQFNDRNADSEYMTEVLNIEKCATFIKQNYNFNNIIKPLRNHKVQLLDSYQDKLEYSKNIGIRSTSREGSLKTDMVSLDNKNRYSFKQGNSMQVCSAAWWEFAAAIDHFLLKHNNIVNNVLKEKLNIITDLNYWHSSPFHKEIGKITINDFEYNEVLKWDQIHEQQNKLLKECFIICPELKKFLFYSFATGSFKYKFGDIAIPTDIIQIFPKHPEASYVMNIDNYCEHALNNYNITYEFSWKTTTVGAPAYSAFRIAVYIPTKFLS